MYRFLLSPRWIGFAVFCVLFAGVCTRLGFWQLDRYHQRLDENEVVRANLDAAPVPIDVLDGGGRTPGQAQEYTEVRLVGTWDAAAQVGVKYQTRDGAPGVDVLTPLVLDSGRAVLVDRGWIETRNTGGRAAELPAPPSGTVEVVGWWRQDSTADGAAVEPQDGEVRAVSSAGMADAVERPLHRGYVELQRQDPAEAQLAPAPEPDLGIGPSLFYSWQWWFFALIAVVGYGWFAWTEAHPRQRRVRPSREDGPDDDVPPPRRAAQSAGGSARSSGALRRSAD